MRLSQWKAQNSDSAAASMPRRVFYLGGWIHHSGWYPDRKIRLYDRRRASWEGDFVHEGMKVEGPVESFRGDLLHFPYRDWQDQLARIDRYTELASQAARHDRPPRQRLKDNVWVRRRVSEEFCRTSRISRWVARTGHRIHGGALCFQKGVTYTALMELALALILGLVIGSFLNVCIVRIPLEMSVSVPRSHCPQCKKPFRLATTSRS